MAWKESYFWSLSEVESVKRIKRESEVKD